MAGGRKWGMTGLLAGVLALCGAPSASATSFCVPDYGPGCNDNGFNVAVGSLESAMGMNATDGIADSIVIQPHTYVDSDTLGTSGTDFLTINGAGPDETIITSSDNGNQFVINFNAGLRPVQMRDLSVVIPSSFPDSLGAAMQLDETSLSNVDVISRNPGSDGIGSIASGMSSINGGEFRGENGGGFGQAIQVAGIPGSGLEVEGVTIRDALIGFTSTESVTSSFKQSRVIGATSAAVEVIRGNTTVENVFITTGEDAEALRLSASGAADVTLTARHVTARGDLDVPGDVAIDVSVFAGSAADGTANVSSSIFRGYNKEFGVVDGIEGQWIKLTKDDMGQHHWIPTEWVTKVDKHVHVDRPGDQAMREWLSSPPQAGQMAGDQMQSATSY